MDKIAMKLGAIWLVVMIVASVFLVVVPSNASAEGNCPEGMVSYWKFEEGSGTIAYDSVGDNDGAFNGAQWTDGQVGYALQFTNAGDYVITDSPGPLGNNPRTVMAWVKTSSTSSQGIVTWGNKGQSQGEFGFYLEDNFLSIRIQQGRMLYEASGINDGNWHHVAIVVHEAGRLGDVQIFLDGVQLTTTLPDSTPDIYLFTGSNKPVYIGSYLGHSTWGQLIGYIDEVAIWNIALTPEEIEQHYENGLEGKGYCYVEPIEADIDIDPNTLNLKSKGKWVTGYISLEEDYDFKDIDKSTVALKGDGFEVGGEYGEFHSNCLTMKFDRQELIGYLNTGMVELIITGELNDGTSFEGSDTIKVIENGK